MKRLTVDKPTKDMSMTELALNNCFVKDGEAWYRDYAAGIAARQLVRDLLDAFGVSGEYADDNDFDAQMAENLADPINSIEGLLAVFYRNLWAMAELHARLKAYEDTGLEPSEVVRYKAFTDKAVTEGVTMAEIKRFINEEDEERPIITDIPIKHLVELGRAEQDGLLVVLPCKEGDTVYVVTELCSDTATVEEGTVESFGFDTAVFVNVAFGGLKRPQTWGKTVFGSREEADAALAQRERGSDNA